MHIQATLPNGWTSTKVAEFSKKVIYYLEDIPGVQSELLCGEIDRTSLSFSLEIDRMAIKLQELKEFMIAASGGTAKDIFEFKGEIFSTAHEMGLHVLTKSARSMSLVDVKRVIGMVERESSLILQSLQRSVYDSTESESSGYLGIDFNFDKGEVNRDGFRPTVYFKSESAEFHTFVVAFKSRECGSTREQWLNGYPGDTDSVSMRNVKRNVNEKLKVIKVQLAPQIPPKLEEIKRVM